MTRGATTEPERTDAGSAQGGVIAALTPALFVILWSTGFIGAKLGMPHAEPMTFLTLRFALTAAALLIAAAFVRAAWPTRPAEWGATVLSGLLMHGVYLGGVFAAISHGVEAGVAALIVGAQPVLTAVLAGPLLGEKITARQWGGLALGVAGVALVVSRKLAAGLGDLTGVGFTLASLAAISYGAIWRKRHVSGSLVTGGAIEFCAAMVFCGALALLFETRVVDWSGEFVFALLWLVGPLSLGAIPLLYMLIRRGAAARVASLFFLVPPATAFTAFFLFDEVFGLWEAAGLALTAAGVLLVNYSGALSLRRPR